jgi:hypothetical protein
VLRVFQAFQAVKVKGVGGSALNNMYLADQLVSPGCFLELK